MWTSAAGIFSMFSNRFFFGSSILATMLDASYEYKNASDELHEDGATD